LLKQVFLSLTTAKTEHRRFLHYVGGNYYIPAAKSDFDELRDAVEKMEEKPRIEAASTHIK